MKTLVPQLMSSVGLLVFAFFAYRVALGLPAHQRTFRYGWTFTAATFGVHGLSSSLHDVFSMIGWRGGEGSAAWDAVLVWHPILNHSRTFLLTTYCLVLCVALLRAQRGVAPPPLGRAMAVVLGGLVVGGVVGANEHAFSGLTHYLAVAVWDLMELLALMAVLLVGISSGGMDRGLWSALGVNAFTLALSVLWFAFLSRIDIGGQWAPRPYHIHLTKTALYGVMIALAYRQLRQMRRGGGVRGFFDAQPRPAVPSMH